MKPFKSINLFRLAADQDLNYSINVKELSKKPFTPCGPGDMKTQGFVAPAPHMPDQIVYFHGGMALIHLQTEEKIIPTAVVKKAAKVRISDIEQAEGRKVSKKEAKDIEDICRDTLKLTAFTRTTTQRVMIDLLSGLVMVEASSQDKAADVLCVLRDALGTFNTSLLHVWKIPSSEMTNWLNDEDNLYYFYPGSDAELKEPCEGGAIARCLNQDLYDAEVKEHLAAGKIVTKIGLEWKEKISFQLTENLEIKKIKYLGLMKEELKNADAKTQDAMLEAGAALFIGEARLIVANLIAAMGGEVD